MEVSTVAYVVAIGSAYVAACCAILIAANPRRYDRDETEQWERFTDGETWR